MAERFPTVNEAIAAISGDLGEYLDYDPRGLRDAQEIAQSPIRWNLYNVQGEKRPIKALPTEGAEQYRDNWQTRAVRDALSPSCTDDNIHEELTAVDLISTPFLYYNGIDITTKPLTEDEQSYVDSLGQEAKDAHYDSLSPLKNRMITERTKTLLYTNRIVAQSVVQGILEAVRMREKRDDIDIGGN